MPVPHDPPRSATRHVCISEWEFIDRFRPEQDSDGSVYVQRFWYEPGDAALIDAASRERRLWTIMDDGAGNAAPVQGRHLFNRECYIVCAVPYDEDELIDVLVEIDYCTICGVRFRDTLYSNDDDQDDLDVVVRSDQEELCVECTSNT
jgi:hypothetical protein